MESWTVASCWTRFIENHRGTYCISKLPILLQQTFHKISVYQFNSPANHWHFLHSEEAGDWVVLVSTITKIVSLLWMKCPVETNTVIDSIRLFHKFITWWIPSHIWTTSWENLCMPYANNKGADQPTHPRSLISIFVARYRDSIIPLVSTSKISSL